MVPKKQERVIEQKVAVSYTYTRKLRLEEKTCPICGKKFEGVKKRVYCSRACQARADYERHADQYRKARVEKYQATKKTANK